LDPDQYTLQARRLLQETDWETLVAKIAQAIQEARTNAFSECVETVRDFCHSTKSPGGSEVASRILESLGSRSGNDGTAFTHTASLRAAQELNYMFVQCQHCGHVDVQCQLTKPIPRPQPTMPEGSWDDED